MSERMTKQMREFVPILRKNGYSKVRSKGSHFTFVNRSTHKIITVNKDLNLIVRERLIKENKLGV